MMVIDSNYKDITKAMFKRATPKSNNVTHAKKFVNDRGEIFIVDDRKNGI